MILPLADLYSLGLAILFPVLATHAAQRRWVPEWSSSIIMCYGVGIVVANLRLWTINGGLMESLAGGSMLIGLPLLLFSVRLGDLTRFGRSMFASFMLCCLAGLFCTGLTALAFAGSIDDGWQIAGMLTGLYTGGTPNVQAIGVALQAPAEYVVLIQAADVLLGGAYLLGLVTVLPAIYARIFPPSLKREGEDAGASMESSPRVSWRQRALQLMTGLCITGAAFVITRFATGLWFSPTALILIVTTLSILFTLSPIVKRIGNAYPLGEYFVLVFCVALGLLADFRELASTGMDLLYFSAVALASTTLLHLILAKLFRMDRDTVILSSVAAFYGPVFVVQVATAIRNQRLLAAGVAVSLLGFGIGNYLGIGLAYTLRWISG